MSAKKLTATWSSKWSPSLASALHGGQWTQVKKAKVASWMIDDSRCQLCFKAPGTVEHRFSCDATRELRCSKPIPKEAEMAKVKLNPERFELLRNRGVVVLKSARAYRQA